MTAARFAVGYDLLASKAAGAARYRATCPACGFAAVRAKREAAEHVLAQHVAYTHDGKV